MIMAETVTVTLVFPAEPIEVDLDIDQCVLEVRSRDGQMKPRVTPNLTWGHGGWYFQLPANIQLSDSVRLKLVERDGKKWIVKPFNPFHTKREVIRLE